MRILSTWRPVAVRTATVLAVTTALAGVASTGHAAARQMAPPTTAILKKALLTVANLPRGGFLEEPLPSGADVDKFAPCPFIADGPQPAEEADASFTSGISRIDTVMLVEALQQYSVNNAKAQLKQFSAIAAGACHDFTVDQTGLHVHLTLSREAFPSFGNGTVALRMNATVINAGNLTFDSDIVAVRHGGTVMVITNTAESHSFNPTLTRVAVTQGYERMSRLL